MTTINITPSKASEVEFDLSIQGLDIENQVSVRLVILKVFGELSLSVECSRNKGNKWLAVIPPGITFNNHTYKFKIEVIVNEYYFEPAEGEVNIILDPVIHRPVISASFEPPAIKKEQKVTTENIIDTTTNIPILTTEPVVEESVQEEVAVDISPFPAIDSEFVEIAEEENIVEEQQLVVETPTVPLEFKRGKGTLLSRSSTGRPVVKGMIVSKEITETKLKNSNKVLEILKSTLSSTH